MGPLQDQSSQDTFYCDEHLSLDFDRHHAMLDSQAIPLTRKEYNLLALLVEHSGRIVPREALLMHADQYIETIYGGGYRFQPFQARRFPRSAVARP